MKYLGNHLRHEYKYYIGIGEYICLRNKLKGILKSDSFSVDAGNYDIRSLYFDDIYDTALYEKNFGLFHRDKYRIRIYNLCNDYIKLERKSKYGEYTNKVSVRITVEQYQNIMRGDFSFLSAGQNHLLNEFHRQYIDRRLRPSVIVDYTREAYLLDQGEVRITFDKDLRYVCNSNDIFFNEAAVIKVFRQPVMILEIKYNDFLPGYVSELVNLHSAVSSEISKYSMCRIRKNNIY